jgi:hypothetical protein
VELNDTDTSSIYPFIFQVYWDVIDKYYRHLRCAMWWFDDLIYINIVKWLPQPNYSLSLYVCVCVCVCVCVRVCVCWGHLTNFK